MLAPYMLSAMRENGSLLSVSCAEGQMHSLKQFAGKSYGGETHKKVFFTINFFISNYPSNSKFIPLLSQVTNNLYSFVFYCYVNQ